MPLPLDTRHRRFVQQARWTRDLRAHLLNRAGLRRASRVLEIGCGTGAVLRDLPAKAAIHGLDIGYAQLRFSHSHIPSAHLVQADAHRLPYASRSFPLVFCHFLLLWVADPARALSEMVRVTHPGGYVISLAEPDYGARIDYPDSLASLGQLQRDSLATQGADPLIGRKLSALFHRAGLQEVEIGLLGGRWTQPPSPEDHQLEWQTLRADLSGQLDDASLDALQHADEAAYASGERILFISTFYALGQVS